jgi:hypothetical protein
MIAVLVWIFVVIFELQPVLVRTGIFPEMDLNHSTNFDGIWSMPKVQSKMM